MWRGLERLMWYVYVLKSDQDGKRYVGLTSKHPCARVKEHNYGSNAWTKQHRPFTLLGFELFEQRNEAGKRERFLKSGHGRQELTQRYG